jgi:hypothetical protein
MQQSVIKLQHIIVLLILVNIAFAEKSATTSSGIPCSTLRIEAYPNISYIHTGSNLTIFYNLSNVNDKDEDAQNISLVMQIPPFMAHPDSKILVNGQNDKDILSSIILGVGNIKEISNNASKKSAIETTTIRISLEKSGELSVSCSRLDPQFGLKFNITTYAIDDGYDIKCTKIKSFGWERKCDGYREDIKYIRSENTSPCISVELAKLFNYKDRIYMFKNESISLNYSDGSPNKKNITYMDKLIGGGTFYYSDKNIKINRSGIHQFGINIGEKSKFNNTKYTVVDVIDYYSEIQYIILMCIFLYILIYLYILNNRLSNKVKEIILSLLVFSILTYIILSIYPAMDFDIPYFPDIFYKDMLIIEILIFTFGFLVFFYRSKSLYKHKNFCNIKWAVYIAVLSYIVHILIIPFFTIPSITEIFLNNFIIYIPIIVFAIYSINAIYKTKNDMACREIMVIFLILISIIPFTFGTKALDPGQILNPLKWIAFCAIGAAFMLVFIFYLLDPVGIKNATRIYDFYKQIFK